MTAHHFDDGEAYEQFMGSQNQPRIPIFPEMPITRKPLEIPPEVARQFAAKMRLFHAEKSPLKRDEIAADTRHLLLEHMPRGTKLRLADVLELFKLMR